MIYLISGAPRTGKTIIASKLSQELDIPWVSADDLEQEVKLKVSKERHAELYPKDAIREKTESSNDIMYTKYSSDEILDAYITQAKATKDAIFSLVENRMINNQSIIIEGHQIQPELIAELFDQFGSTNIKAVILVKDGVNNIVDTARSHHGKNDWFINKTSDPAIHFKIAEMLEKYSRYFETEAQKYNLKTVKYQGDFNQQKSEALRILMT